MINDVKPNKSAHTTTGAALTPCVTSALVERVTKAMIEKNPPDIYFNPRLVGIRILEFDKAEDVFKQVEAAVPKLKERLKAV